MTYKISIFSGLTVCGNGGPYGTRVNHMKIMDKVFLYSCALFLCVFIISVNGDMEYYPGLRRPPNWLRANDDDASYILAKINNIIEEQARRRFQQQLIQLQSDRDPTQQQEIMSSSFSYQFPVNGLTANKNEPIVFAVGPSDSRYYEASTPNLSNSDKSGGEDYEDSPKSKILAPKTSDTEPAFKLKAPMHVNPKIGNNVDSYSSKTGMIDKLSKSVATGEQSAYSGGRSGVSQRPMDIDGTMGMYIVALIAGISAAVTVGLIAVGIGWYTLQKKAKAAADVEYPAYGVTGPNKDISPSVDRRLAQSAQMYHYQHQKQQIIAMENNSTGDRNGTLSDVESDEENEEGDYTVYECPGLAPTGEMEVKNPLFLDDPTPASQPQQPTPPQQTTPGKTTNTTKTTSNVTSDASEESAKKPNKKN